MIASNSVRAAVAAAVLSAAALGGSRSVSAAESEAKKDDVLEEVQVTGSRIVRKDTQSNSPLVTVDRRQLDDSAYISIEQTLNELPQFLAGGAGMGADSVTSLTAQGTLNGGAGSGTMFDNSRLPETGGRVGTFTPGAATVNLRGLGSNRSLTLIDGHRGQPTNASMSLDLNTIPQAAIASMEVITGGASAVYGADALAGVTNIKLRDNFEGLNVRTHAGINEFGGDGREYQISSLMGTNLAGKGNAMLGIEYSRREVALWNNRAIFREVMESPYSNSGSYAFGYWPGYDASTGTAANTGCNVAGTICTTTSNALTAGGGSFSGNVWSGNRPSQAAVNSVFGDRTCGTSIACVSNAGSGGGFYFNDDGTLFTRSSSCVIPTTGTNLCGPQVATTVNYGPQGFNGQLGGTPEFPNKVTCTYAANTPNQTVNFSDRNCAPTLNRVDYGRWLTSPREAVTLFGSAKYQITDRLRAFSTLSFASSQTQTRREPAPATGTFTAVVPYHSNPNAVYLPSVAQYDVVSGGVTITRAGDTLREFRAGGSKGTNCPTTGGCTMQQAFPVPTELATLLNSRPDVTRSGAPNLTTNPWGGLSTCEIRARDTNTTLPGHVAQVPASGGRPAYTVQIDPNTGETFKICGPNSAWRVAQQFNFLPPRGTENIQRTYQLAAGLQGDIGVKDWTWEAYLSQGDARTNTEYEGLASTVNYRKIISAPNYGKGYREENTNAAKIITCTSGLSPFSSAPVSQDCIDAIASNQVDRNTMRQWAYEFNTQGGVVDLPAGEARAAFGASFRKNSYTFIPDSLRERDYVADTSPGQFGIGFVDAGVSVKEVYGELLVPLLANAPAVRSLELELGGRLSKYSTGQDVPTWKALLSWAPLEWMRVRGGFNRAERAPNIAELYTSPTTNTAGGPVDPCLTTATTAATQLWTNTASNPNRAALQALCSAQIDLYGGNGGSEFQGNPGTFTQGGGVATVVGNPALDSEKGQTWTLGVVMQSPFEHPLASRITSTVDWYEARIDAPIEVLSGTAIASACFNQNGENPTFSLDDAGGYCRLMERDPTTGALLRTTTPYANNGKLVIRGMDISTRWSAALVDMGIDSMQGTLSVSLSANLLFDQIQPLTAGGVSRDYVGLQGASKVRTNTNVSYNWGDSRVSLTWNYRLGTKSPILGTNDPDPARAGYPTTNLFNATAGTRLGPVNASFTVSNLLNTKPGRAGYLFADPSQGLGSFNPYGDTVGRRYAVNLSMDF
jgi:iron complex outermembrane recepter protein